MQAKQYRKRFLAGVQRLYLLVMPVMLGCLLLVNNVIYDLYYDYLYARTYVQAVEQVARSWQQTGQLPRQPGVSYRQLAPGTAPYTYITERYVMQGGLGGEIQYTTTLTQGREQIEVTIRHDAPDNTSHSPGVTLVVVAISLLLFLLLSWLLFRFSIRRLSYNLWHPFYQNLRRINAFNLREREPLTLAPTEIREFASFNEAITHFTAKVQQSYDELREFTENTAHELQTPLAVVLAKTELLLQRNQLAAADRQDVLEVRTTVKRLSALQKSLNLLSRVRALHYGGELPREILDATALLHDILTTYADLLDYKDVHLSWQARQPWLLHTNRELLHLLLDNLVRNAVQHNRPAGRLVVTATPTGLTLGNTGRADAPHPTGADLFQRYRTQSADSGHLGLGLALVAASSEVLGLACTYTYHEALHCFRLTALARSSKPKDPSPQPGSLVK